MGLFTMYVFFTAFATILHFVPSLFPFFSPIKGPITMQAYFRRQVCLFDSFLFAIFHECICLKVKFILGAIIFFDLGMQ